MKISQNYVIIMLLVVFFFLLVKNQKSGYTGCCGAMA